MLFWDIPIIFNYKKTDQLSFYTSFRYSRDKIKLQYLEKIGYFEYEYYEKEINYTLGRFGIIFGASYMKDIAITKRQLFKKSKKINRTIFITPEIGLLATDQIYNDLFVIPIYAFKFGFLFDLNKKK